MDRTVQFFLNKVSPVPPSLRVHRRVDAAATHTTVNLGSLFMHYYFDSYPGGPPKPDPSRFEYLDLVSSSRDFRVPGLGESRR